MTAPKGTVKLSTKLLDRIYTTKDLKLIVDLLETLAQDRGFKAHSTSIVTDSTLTNSQKKNQLLYLIQSLDEPLLLSFFADEINEQHFWIFNSGRIDYFDKFVKSFQEAVEQVTIVKLVTAIKLSDADYRRLSLYFSEFLGKKAILNHEINSTILGGTITMIENFIFDHSIRSKLHTLRSNWIKTLKSISDRVETPPG